MSGFNVVTFLNNHDTRDADHVVLNDPILGYTYLLTNNQVGLPSVFYPDYYTMPDYKPFPGYNIPGMKKEINELWNIHKKYIFRADQIDYLSRFNTPYAQNFNSGSANKTLLYQVMSEAPGSRDLLVAINYADNTLDVDHGINTAQGKVFVNLLDNSASIYTSVDANGIANIKVPAKSYSVWIEGVTIEAKIFLQGAYNTQTHLMNTTLRDNNLLPLISPYTKDQRTVENIDESIVDWVLVELYYTLNDEAIVSKSVFVKNNGMLCLEDGSTKIPLDAPSDDYYLVIRHRNHLAVASKEKISVSAATPIYDFTTD
ncbi:MAG: hypothetical protein CR986_03140 [Ignavibacteriae bacterium]|nr:MAG: hypothetical protein CR986_03140 [Ignavibacteriota bacterium]